MYFGWWLVILLFSTLIHTAGSGFFSGSVYMPRIIEALKCTTFAYTAAGAMWAVVYGLSSPLVGTWIHRFGARKVFITGISAAGVNALLWSMVTKIWHLVLLNMVSGFVAVATILIPTQTVITMWFDKYRGRAMALTLMGIGFGGFLTPLLITWLVSIFDWRVAFRCGAVLNYLIVLPPVYLFLKNKPSDVDQPVDGIEPKGKTGTVTGPSSGVTIGRALGTATFWLIMGAHILQLFVLSGIQTNTQNFAEMQMGYSATVLIRST
jgi:MFS family permease